MEMNEILNGLNSCGCNDDVAPHCPDQTIGSCNNNGCFGFGSWIWILLILFYSGGFGGGRGGNRKRCCCKERKRDCCCEERECCCEGGRGYGGGGLGNCTPYLFLLVILFLCGGNCGNFGNCGGFGSGNIFGGCC